MKYHYVYRITNLMLRKHYYGVRSCSCEPSKDLGIKYFSSSSDKEFIQDQKENLNNYRYKVIKIFNNRKNAGNFEVKIHHKLNVSINESFYNKANQTSEFFTIYGLKHTPKSKEKMRQSKVGKLGPNLGKKFSDEHRKALSIAQQNRTDDRSHSEETKRKIGKANKGKAQSEETKKKRAESLKGHKQSDETKKKRSESLKGRTFSEESLEKMRKPQQKAKCPHCGKEGGQSAMTRYHFDNCKRKIDGVLFKYREQP